VPKTGGSWVKKAIEAAGIEFQDYRVNGDPHIVLKDCPVPEKFKFAFIRHPLDIFRSYWQFKMGNGWDEKNPFDMSCKTDSFQHFIEIVLTQYPGSYGILLSEFIGEAEYEIEFVGKYENLVEDLISALNKAGETFNAQAIRDYPPYNVSKKEKFPAVYTDQLAEQIQLAEIMVMKRFGYEMKN